MIAVGSSMLEKIQAYWFRAVGCDHSLEIDLGDEDGPWNYCFKCMRRT